MRVAAGLQTNAGRRRAGQIRGHHRGGPAQEGERIGTHATVTDRQQFLYPVLALLDQDADRIGAVDGWGPISLRATRHVMAERCPGLPADVRTACRHRLVVRGRLGVHHVTVLYVRPDARDDPDPLNIKPLRP